MSDEILEAEVDELRTLVARLRKCISRGRGMAHCTPSRAVCARADLLVDEIERGLDRIHWSVPLPPPHPSCW